MGSDFHDFVIHHETTYLSLCSVRSLKLFVNLGIKMTQGTGDKELTCYIQMELFAEFVFLEISFITWKSIMESMPWTWRSWKFKPRKNIGNHKRQLCQFKGEILLTKFAFSDHPPKVKDKNVGLAPIQHFFCYQTVVQQILVFALILFCCWFISSLTDKERTFQ